ncbi:MAG: CHAT domain-containing protein [Burkholderiales bacterium]|nr:CHAT domain-containing protein [Burkholderiales bacterium]
MTDGSSAHSFDAKILAQALASGNGSLPTDISANQREALAWELKDAALACWSTNPTQVSSIAAALQQLLALDDNTPASPIPALRDSVAAYEAIAAGRMTEADTLLQQAAGKFRALGLASAAAQTQVPRVLVLCMQGRLDDAERCGIAARDELLALGDTHAASRVSLNLGQLSCERSHFGVAVTHFESAIAGFRHADDRERAAQSSIGLADALAATGEFEAALQHYAEARGERSTGSWPVLAALCDESAALIRLARGEYAPALAGLEEARRQYQQLQMPQHLANAERQLGQVYLELHLLPEAIALLQNTIDRFMSLEMHLEAAWTRVELANAIARQHAEDPRVDTVLSQAEHVFVAEAQVAGQATVALARAEQATNLGQVDRALKLASGAEATFRRLDMPASAIRAALLVAECAGARNGAIDARDTFSHLLSSAHSRGLLSIELRALLQLGYLACGERDYDLAKSHFERAVALVEEQRFRLVGDDLRYAFQNSTVAPYRELLRLALGADGEQSNTFAIVLALERFRARALADRLGSVATVQGGTNARLDELHHRLSWSQRRLRRLHEEGEDTGVADAELRQLENEYLEVQRRSRLVLHERGAKPAATNIDHRMLTALQEALREAAAVVEYGVLDDELFACIVDGQSVRVVRHIALWSDVEGAIRRVQFQMDAMRTSRLLPQQHVRQLEARARHALQQLHAMIWAPLTATLGEAKRLLVVPHSKLGAIAFAALHDGNGYLGENAEIAIAPSLAVAAQVLARRAPTIAAPLVLADTKRLAHAIAEADAVQEIFPRAQVRTRDDASGDALRQLGRTAECIHFACHGVFRSDNPMFSALELADGNFSAIDAEKLNLTNPLVVLSACDSGVATEAEGDEVFGLVRAFLIGGASRVVASLWPVDDDTTVEWMKVFYRSLQAGAAPAQAGLQAQQAVREQHPHPFHWAAFVTFGAW